MRQEEAAIAAQFIFENLDLKDLSVCVNFGSGDVTRLLAKKPWIEDHIFFPLRREGVRIVHVDQLRCAGVDIICDLGAPQAFDFLDQFQTPRLLILANVMEHLGQELRDQILPRIHAAMRVGDALLVTVPFDYPYHPDPIDTMFRPDPPDLMRRAPLNWVGQAIVEAGSFRQEFDQMSIFKRARKLIRPLWPFQSISSWRKSLRVKWLFRPYRVTVVLGIKTA